jgi:hypothetical protein
MSYFGLGLLFLSVAVGGISVDVMRQETSRAKAQRALDACTVNAAVIDLPDAATKNPGAAIDACMGRAGASGLVGGVSATNSTDYRTLTASASGSQTNQFMQMLNISTLNIGTGSAADVPGKAEVVVAFEAANQTSAIISTLRTGLQDFVTRLYANDTSSTKALTLVPYNNGVNLSATMRSKYTVTNLSGVTNSNCIEAKTGDFGSLPILTTTAYDTRVPADLNSYVAPITAYAAPTQTGARPESKNSICPFETSTVIREPSSDATTIKTQIGATGAAGGTRWDYGMHWAAAMLDPSANSAIKTTAFPGVPQAHGTANLQKVIVFVNKSGSGDVEATGQSVVLAPAYASGLSPIKRDNSGNYCINHPTGNGSNAAKWFQPLTGTWTTACTANGYTTLTWPQVWRYVSASWVAGQLYARPLAQSLPTTTKTALQNVQDTYLTELEKMKSYVAFSTQEANFKAECDAAKAAGIVIYTVAVDAAERGKPGLKYCASSVGHYFETSSANLSGTMKIIAQTIAQQGYVQ